MISNMPEVNLYPSMAKKSWMVKKIHRERKSPKPERIMVKREIARQKLEKKLGKRVDSIVAGQIRLSGREISCPL